MSEITTKITGATANRFKGFIFDAGEVREFLLNPEVLAVLKTFPKSVLEFFADRLCDMLASDDFYLSPRPESGSAGIAFDDKGFVRIVCGDDGASCQSDHEQHERASGSSNGLRTTIHRCKP